MRKNMILLIFVLMALLCGCQGTDSASGSSNEGYDQNQWEMGVANICRNENGYFAALNINDTNMIYTIDKDGTAVPLCSKAECTHDTEECNAYLNRPQIQTIWYDGAHLYIIAASNGTTYSLYEVSIDGSGSREICSLFQASGYSAFSLMAYYKEGFLYYSLQLQSAADAANGTYAEKLYRIRIENGAEPELICENTEDVESVSSSIGRCYFYEDSIYFTLNCYANDGSSGATTLYRYHIEENQLEDLGERYMAYYCVVDDVLFYTAENGIHQYNLKDGTESMFYEDPALMGDLIYDGQYFYASDGRYIRATEEESPDSYSIYVIDRKGNLVDIIESDWERMLFYGDGDALIAEKSAPFPEKEQDAEQFYFYDKSQIGTDQDAWKMVEIVTDWK